MKRFTLMACAGLMAAAMATPSLAADLPRPAFKAPVYVAPFSWTGFYVGINGGYGWGNVDVTTPAGTTTTSSNQTGWLIGGTAGYNLQTGNWVWGLEGDLDYALIKGNSSNTAACAGGTCTFKDTYFATARGRIGYALDRWLPYFTGGAAFSGVQATSAGGGTSNNNSVGWTLGGGVEYAFLGAWSAKLEYLYADLGKSTCGATICGVATDFEPKVNIIRAGINYRF
jgi:outer membrane immunogenic protein